MNLLGTKLLLLLLLLARKISLFLCHGGHAL